MRKMRKTCQNASMGRRTGEEGGRNTAEQRPALAGPWSVFEAQPPTHRSVQSLGLLPAAFHTLEWLSERGGSPETRRAEGRRRSWHSRGWSKPESAGKK